MFNVVINRGDTVLARFAILAVFLANPSSVHAEQTNATFEQIFDVMAARIIYVSTWDQLLERLKPWCAASTRAQFDQIHGNIECSGAVDVTSILASSDGNGRVSLLTAVFKGRDKCSYITSTLKKNFGHPATLKGECQMEWRMPRQKNKPQRLIGIDVSDERDEIYFAIGEEQGP
jgi:hypothetical protein